MRTLVTFNEFFETFILDLYHVFFRPLLTFSDQRIVLVSHPNKALWQRDEALASVVDAAMLDLPLSDVDAGIEAEFEDKGKTNIVQMFTKVLPFPSTKTCLLMAKTVHDSFVKQTFRLLA